MPDVGRPFLQNLTVVEVAVLAVTLAISVEADTAESCRSQRSPVGQNRLNVRKHVSVYRVTELIGTSTQSWEDAASVAIKAASGTLRDLRVAKVVEQDIQLCEDGALTYRTKLQVSFKYEGTV